MPKRVKKRGQPTAAPRKRLNKRTVVALAVCLILAGAAAAQWLPLRHAPATTAALVPATSAQSGGSFAPQNPAKEYIYAGGRLVATEEPVVGTLPAAPTNAKAGTGGSEGFGLLWTDNSNNETGFKIESCHLVNGTWTQWQQIATVGANVTHYGDSLGCEYKYRVKAWNEVGDSAYSNEFRPKSNCWIEDGETLLVEDVVWTDVVNAQVTGNSLQKLSGTNSWYDSGAVSTRAIASSTGYVEFTPANSVTWRMIGLGNGNTGQYYGDIEYGLYLGGSGDLHIYEAGLYRGQFGTYAASDRLRVAVANGTVRYYKNDVLVYVSSVTATYPLLVDTSLNTVNSQINDVKIATTSFGGVSPPQDVVWTAVSSTLQVTGNSLQKVSGGNSWYDAGAVSSKAIASGDGYVEFHTGHTVTWRLCGLGNGNDSAYYGDIEYAFYMGGGGDLHIYEAGLYRGQFGTYAASDWLKVAVEGGQVKYYQNGTLIYTSGVAPTYPLLVDTSFNTVNAAVYFARMAGNLTP